MRKITILAALLMVFAVTVRAQWNLPTAKSGTGMLPPSEAPCVGYHVNSTTGTVEKVFLGSDSLTGNTVTYTPGYVSWIQLSSGTSTTAIEIRDTDKISAKGYYALAPIMFPGSLVGGGNVDTGKQYSNPIVFQPPLLLQIGGTVKLTDTGAAATVCYRKMTRQYP